ncbi:hypothetical protein N7510_001267 [Penicillium lagena]|uniref:uncharacterized protein n=1 Tax=Penicillium lagena TaxID=94218 RepID=UPI00253FF9CB|nr:uncharacterized protein N7510_001267 [Penicillium lagena]KAJ5624958.1 hypothetical protein N7510_001267 [Penicillium lagena]
MDSPRRPRNPAACRRCQRRKIRCNGALPRCGSCAKANATCINDGKQEVSRSYIANLQQRIQELESLVNEQGSTTQLENNPQLNDFSHIGIAVDGVNQHDETAVYNSTNRRSPSPQQSNAQPSRTSSRQAHEIGLVSLSAGGEPRYIGPSSGYFLANLVFSSAGRRTRPQRNRGNVNEPISLSAELFNSPASLPTHKEDAIELTSKYFATVHLIYPFLHEPSHMQRLEEMYSIGAIAPDPSMAFHVYMVLAIAASDLSRRFKIRLPAEGYYTAATQFFDQAYAEGTLEGLQSLLLLMVYALHNPSCGVNIWSLNYQCLGSLIDLGLQRDVRASSTFPISFLQQEMRTRIFWVVYTLDRTLGTMMGRPIGVRDEACELRFPSDISDSCLTETVARERTNDSPPSHMTYSIHLFKLARMNSEIKYIMHSISRDVPRYALPPIPDIHLWQSDMIKQLESWHSEIRSSAGMESISRICETKYHEMMILVLRPSPGIPDPSEESLSLCFTHAVELVRAFGELYREEALLYSRLIVHSLFLSTLIILHTLWRLPQIAARVQIDEVVADTGISLNILSSIGEYWTEAKRARDCIHELTGVTIQRLVKVRSAGASSAAPCSSRTFSSNTMAGSIRRTQDKDVILDETIQADSGMGPMTSLLDGEDLNTESTSWLNDLMPGGFMNFTGAPNFDSLMWEVYSGTQ